MTFVKMLIVGAFGTQGQASPPLGVPDGLWHLEPKVTFTFNHEGVMENIHEVYVYAVRHRMRRRELLVCRTPRGASASVPHGLIGAHEAPAEAALRHLRAIAGLGDEVGRVWIVYVDWVHPSDPGERGRVRYFFGVEVEHEERPRWQHVVSGDVAQNGTLLECFFAKTPLGMELEAGSEYLGEL